MPSGLSEKTGCSWSDSGFQQIVKLFILFGLADADMPDEDKAEILNRQLLILYALALLMFFRNRTTKITKFSPLFFSLSII